ncbi:hypothetical protein BGZ65_003273 [Modicella reniformis]|uniref:Uncharacterized protein n=1 Tax=Modicella reniformis TaxID=1440133 RepID=A0A9P6MIG6_9FUNG|nr:hypothetical protein BGZ65_003273 [Modicella reniformis]
MAKTMKDMHDLIRTRSTRTIRSSLKTFGMCISGPSITFYSLCQQRGRFYQLNAESTIMFPARWRGSTTTNILSVLAKLLVFKNELSETADQITEATKVLKTFNQDNEDFWAATLTTPTNSPRLSPHVRAVLTSVKNVKDVLEATAAKTSSHLFSNRITTSYEGHIQRGKASISQHTATALLTFVGYKCEIDKAFETPSNSTSPRQSIAIFGAKTSDQPVVTETVKSRMTPETPGVDDGHVNNWWDQHQDSKARRSKSTETGRTSQ